MTNATGNLLNKPHFKALNIINLFCSSLNPRNLNEVELECCMCARWFHRNCIEIDPGLASFA